MDKNTTGTEISKQRNKGGRPTLPKARRRSKSVTVKFSKIDYETLRVRCRKVNRRLAEYIREAALQSEIISPHTKADADVFRNLVGVANNLNQLTRLSHQTSLYQTNRKLDETLDKVMEIVNEYRQGKERNG